MKKSFIFIVFLLSSLLFVSAQTNVSQTNTPNPDNLINSANQFIEKDISVPEPLQIFAKIFFGFEEKISLQMLIIVISLWVLFLVAFADIMSFSVFSERTSWAIAICLTVILGALGTIRSLSVFILNQSLSIRFLEKWPAGALTLVFVVIILILGITHRLFRGLKEHKLIEQNREKGIKIGAKLGIVDWIARTYEDVADSFRPTRR